MTSPGNPDKPRKLRGFAAMAATPEGRARVAEIARQGGKAAHAAGTAHEFTKEEAQEAGRKGGKAMHANAGTRKAAGETVSQKTTVDDVEQVEREEELQELKEESA